MGALDGRVAVVAGATRGAGRGIAVSLGEAGATVYCTGRSVRGRPAGSRPETIDETAEMVSARGGVGIAMRVDHSEPEEVRALAERVRAEQGRLDVLVNDIWGGDELTAWDKPFWEHSLEDGLLMQRRAVHTHIITSHSLAPLMVARGAGLIIEITDGDSLDYYRGNLYYDLAKVCAIRLGYAMAQELEPHHVTAVALTPGFLRSEAMLDYFGVSEANWRDAAAQEPSFAGSETPYYIGRAVAALASDPDVFRYTGQTLSTWNLAREYGFTDVDGSQPYWPDYYEPARREEPDREGDLDREADLDRENSKGAKDAKGATP